jgi:hypothetical protein
MIREKIDSAAAEQRAVAPIEGIDPELILKVTLAAPIQEDSWRTAGFKVLAQEQGDVLILFTDDTEMRSFRERLSQYQEGTAEDRQNPAYNSLFASIEDIGSVTAADRVGPRMRAEGIAQPADIDERAKYTVDIELWDAPTQLDKQVRVQKLVQRIERAGGEILSRYVGTAGLIILRARVRGPVLRGILELTAVARTDLRPIPDLGDRDAPEITLADISDPAAPAADAPLIGIIDSGSTDHPLLAPSLVESLGVPDTLGTADIWGHGTKVAGIAAFGDVRECVARAGSPVQCVSLP